MKPSELYARTPEETVAFNGDYSEFLQGCYYNHVPETEGMDTGCLLNGNKFKRSDRIQFDVHKYFEFDMRPRFWRLVVVRFDAVPFMVLQNAGREGDDHVGRFITDKYAYADFVGHLLSLYEPDSIIGTNDIVDAEDDIPSLTDFYGNQLDGYFERY